MARVESKKGATSAHTLKAKGGTLQHNRRTQEAANVNPQRSHLNTSWESDRIKELKSTRSLIRRAEKLYTDKVKQKCQASFAPLKETVVVCKPNSTMEEAQDFAQKCQSEIPGIECLGIWFHRDEGAAKSKVEPTSDKDVNWHIHILWNCQNQETGKAIPITRNQMSKMQDWAAASFHMERGNRADVTGRKHIPSMEYKIQALTNELNEMSQTIEELKEEKAGLLQQMEDTWKYRGKYKRSEAEKEAIQAEFDAFKQKTGETIAELQKTAENARIEAKNAQRERDREYDERKKVERQLREAQVATRHWRDKYTEATQVPGENRGMKR